MDRPPTHRKSSNSLALRILIITMLIVTLSCTIISSDESDTDTSAKDTEVALSVEQTMAAKAEQESPTDEPPAPTAPPPSPTPEPPEALPTEAPAPEQGASTLINPNASAPGDIYYSEKFEDMEGWWVYPLRGDETGWSYEVFDNRLRTEINSQDTWVYYMFEGAGNFQDVRIDITVENRASNTNYVGIICRSSDSGWYEANILNTGEYVLYYGNPDDSSVKQMYKGASRLIKTGKSINSYAMICNTEQLTLRINGVEVVSLPLRTGNFNFLGDGQVGISVSTTDVIPVAVDFLQFVMSVP